MQQLCIHNTGYNIVICRTCILILVLLTLSILSTLPLFHAATQPVYSTSLRVKYYNRERERQYFATSSLVVYTSVVLLLKLIIIIIDNQYHNVMSVVNIIVQFFKNLFCPRPPCPPCPPPAPHCIKVQ